MRINAGETMERGGKLVRVFNTEGFTGPDRLCFEVDGRWSALVSTSQDAALIALLIPAMSVGGDLAIEGEVSGRLLYNANGDLQRILGLVLPGLKPVRVFADGRAPERVRAGGVITGFSGGIDSFALIADHGVREVPDGYGLTHLLYNNVGSHGPGERGRAVFDARHARLVPAAERMGLPFVRVESNLDDFYGAGLGFVRTHSMRNTSAATLLGGGVGRYLYASAYSYADILAARDYDSIAFLDPMLLPLLSSAGVEVVPSGSGLTRVEKTMRVTLVPESIVSLDVCVKPDPARGRNCSVCWKCMRTLLTLEIAGEMERYNGVFDLAAYHRRKGRFIARSYADKNPLLREIYAFAAEKGFNLPLAPRVVALLKSLFPGGNSRH